MYELRDDDFYRVLAEYPRCAPEFCLMKNDGPAHGEAAHREALRFALSRFSEAVEEPWSCRVEAAAARRIDPKALLALPEKPWREKLVLKGEIFAEALHVETNGGELPYWNAFLEPPWGVVYGPEDFLRLNAALFPRGPEALEVLSWSTDWSDYFDDGHEWWGAACWSVYDRTLDRYAVIMASATD